MHSALLPSRPNQVTRFAAVRTGPENFGVFVPSQTSSNPLPLTWHSSILHQNLILLTKLIGSASIEFSRKPRSTWYKLGISNKRRHLFPNGGSTTQWKNVVHNCLSARDHLCYFVLLLMFVLPLLLLLYFCKY